MNKLSGIIKQIQVSEAIILVDVEVSGQLFSALLIESANQPEWLSEGNKVDLVFKETEVSLAKNLSGTISLRNRMSCVVVSIEKGKLLSKVNLKFRDMELSSAITSRSVEALQLAVGDEVEALVKSNEVSLMRKNEPNF